MLLDFRIAGTDRDMDEQQHLVFFLSSEKNQLFFRILSFFTTFKACLNFSVFLYELAKKFIFTQFFSSGFVVEHSLGTPMDAIDLIPVVVLKSYLG